MLTQYLAQGGVQKMCSGMIAGRIQATLRVHLCFGLIAASALGYVPLRATALNEVSSMTSLPRRAAGPGGLRCSNPG